MYKPIIYGDREGAYTASEAECSDVRAYVDVGAKKFMTLEVLSYKRLMYYVVTKGNLGDESPEVYLKVQPSQKHAVRALEREIQMLGPSFKQVDVVSLFPNCSVAAKTFVKKDADSIEQAKSIMSNKKVETTSLLDKEVSSTLDYLYKVLNRSLVEQSYSGVAIKGEVSSLGLPSLAAIEAGREILMQVSKELDFPNLNVIKALNDKYNQTIPRYGKPVIFNSPDILQEQYDYLANLEFMVSSAMLQAGFSPDMFLAKNGLDMVHIDKDSREFSAILSKIKNEGKSTHKTNFTLKNVFRLKTLEGCKWPSFNPQKLGNVATLFHGTADSNMLAILSTSLKMPLNVSKSVSRTGAMFGSGCYFGEFSKSMQYSSGRFSGHKSKRYYILICEVALGRPFLTASPMNVNKAPTGYNSIIGVGRESMHKGIHIQGVVPNYDFHIDSDTIRHRIKSSPLLYCEFIIFNRNQIRPLYLLEMEW